MQDSQQNLFPCSKCKLPKPRTEFHRDRYSRTGYTHQCAACRNRKDEVYYDANAEELRKIALSRKEGRTVEKGPRFAGVDLKLHFDAGEVRRASLAFTKEFGKRPTQEQLRDYLARHARGGVEGHSKYILEKRVNFE